MILMMMVKGMMMTMVIKMMITTIMTMTVMALILMMIAKEMKLNITMMTSMFAPESALSWSPLPPPQSTNSSHHFENLGTLRF